MRAETRFLVFRRNGRVHLNRQGRQFSRLLAGELCTSACRVCTASACVLQSCDAYWLPTPFSCFPFTSPSVPHRVPSHFKRSLPFTHTHLRFLWLLTLPWSSLLPKLPRLTGRYGCTKEPEEFRSADFPYLVYIRRFSVRYSLKIAKRRQQGVLRLWPPVGLHSPAVRTTAITSRSTNIQSV